MALYHYTTETRHANIMKSGRLLPSEDTQYDSTYGAGWYLTDLSPSTCEKTLMQYCWQRTTLYQRVSHYLELGVEGGNVYKVREHVHFVPKSLLVTFKLVSQGEVPECTLKPCHSCPLNPDKY
jgi:hypothetical protein